jgi:hypothetical protein
LNINFEIDCTPLEAWQFFMPLQAAVMDKLQQQMTSNIEKTSPESLMQTWFTFDPKIADHFQDMFIAMAGGGNFWTERLSGASAPTRLRRAAA